MNNKYSKRVFSPKRMWNDFIDIVSKPKQVKDLLKGKNIHGRLTEKLMLTVTSVNECRYCTWLHSDTGLAAGISKEQIEALLNGEIEDKDEIALKFALHYAETDQQPEQAEVDFLKKNYGEEKSRDIVTALKLIFFGNLTGNTFDAFFSRLKGKPAEGSNFFFEIFVFLIGFIPGFFILIFTQKGRSWLANIFSPKQFQRH